MAASFRVPAFPLEEVHDPTGAGDSFAGGFMGYLANASRMNDAVLRRAMVYGSVMGSFAVEQLWPRTHSPAHAPRNRRPRPPLRTSSPNSGSARVVPRLSCHQSCAARAAISERQRRLEAAGRARHFLPQATIRQATLRSANAGCLRWRAGCAHCSTGARPCVASIRRDTAAHCRGRRRQCNPTRLSVLASHSVRRMAS